MVCYSICSEVPLPLAEGLTYLRIHITSRLEKVYALNYTPMLEFMRNLLQEWNKLCYSKNGNPTKISISNANAENQTSSFLLCINLKPVRYILWIGKTSRIALSHLTRPKEQGIIGRPDIKYYYLACPISRIADLNLHGRKQKIWSSLSPPPTPFSPLVFHCNTPSRPEK